VGCSSIRSLSATDLIPQVRQHNPRLADALAAITIPTPKGKKRLPEHAGWRCFVATYPYGATIVKRGQFQTPCAVADCADCAALARDCEYSPIPLGLLLSNSIEVHLEPKEAEKSAGAREEADRYTVPQRMLSVGETFGVFETLQAILGEAESRAPWSVSAGARSVWVLAPLGDQRMPQELGEIVNEDIDWTWSQMHWSLIAQAMRRSDWNVEIAFLPRQIVELLTKDDVSTKLLFEFLLETGWQQSAALRRMATIESGLRQTFLDQSAKRPSCDFEELYLFATICHLLAIGRGDAPAFEPAGAAKTEYGPFTGFEKQLHAALKGIRRKKEAHYPVVLQPVHLNAKGDRGLYSFRCPSLPGLKRPEVDSYAELSPLVKKAMELMAADANHGVDLRASLCFTQTGKYDLKDDRSLVGWKTLLGHVRSSSDLFKKERLYFESSFLKGGLQIVRGQ
jgi:hypothetical protein